MVTHTQDTCNIMINNSGSVPNTEEGTCILFGVGCTWVLQAWTCTCPIINYSEVRHTIHTYLPILHTYIINTWGR